VQRHPVAGTAEPHVAAELGTADGELPLNAPHALRSAPLGDADDLRSRQSRHFQRPALLVPAGTYLASRMAAAEYAVAVARGRARSIVRRADELGRVHQRRISLHRPD